MAVVRFGVFELDDVRGELRRQGRRVHLAAQPLSALALLTARAGSIVTREELRHHLWGDDHFVEFDRSLNFCIAEVRRALGDEARSSRFVETVPKRGYRFIADVHPVDAPVAITRSSQRRWIIAAATVTIVCIQQPFRTVAHTRATAHPEARAAFERAMQISEADGAGRRRGIAALRSAARIDPRFAEAHYALAELYLDLALKRELPMAAAIAEARLEAERAVALEDFAETRSLLGMIRLIADWDWSGARRELARAVALQPKWDFGFVTYARILSGAGDDAAAMAAIDRAETLSPNCDLILFHAGEIYARAGRYDEALDKLERAIVFGPPRNMGAADWTRQVRSRQFMINMARGDTTAAFKSAAALVRMSGASEAMQQQFEAQGPSLALERFLTRSVATTTAQPAGGRERATNLARLEALRGRAEAALDWLEQAARDRDPDVVYILRDPELHRLRALARYRALDARIRGS